MTEQTQTLDNNETLVPDVSTVAALALTSDQSWEILNQLFASASQKLLTTQGFVVPVLNQLPVLREKLKDPVAFERSFNTLINDIRQMNTRLAGIRQQHQGKSGVPTEADWTLTFSVSQEYSNLITEFDTVITPLIFSLIETIKNEHGDMLEMPTVQDAQQ